MTITNKTIKFDADLADKILSAHKTSTWRLFDDKDLQTGDIVTFIRRPELVPFAEARLIEVYEKPFSEMKPEDMDGHEQYTSAEAMYRSFEKYYHKKIDGNTIVKIIKFNLLSTTL